MHQRKAIRAAAVAALTNKTAAEERVFPSRVLPYRLVDLPVLAVYSLQEDVDGDSRQTAPRELTRDLSLVVEGWVASGPGVDDALDDLAEEIEAAMDADRYLGDTAAESILSSTVVEVVAQSDREIGLLMLTYDVTYRTEQAPATTNVDDYLTTDAVYNLGNAVDPGDQAEDNFEMQE